MASEDSLKRVTMRRSFLDWVGARPVRLSLYESSARSARGHAQIIVVSRALSPARATPVSAHRFARSENLVNQTVFACGWGGEDLIAINIAADLF